MALPRMSGRSHQRPSLILRGHHYRNSTHATQGGGRHPTRADGYLSRGAPICPGKPWGGPSLTGDAGCGG